MTFEYGTLERIRAGIACYVAEYFEIAAVVWHVKYSIDGMIEQLDFFGVIGPVLFLWKSQNKMSVCVFKQHDGWMDGCVWWMDGWERLERRFDTYFSPTLLEDNSNAVNWYLYGYLTLLQILHFALVLREREKEGRCKHARQRYKCHGGGKFARIFN